MGPQPPWYGSSLETPLRYSHTMLSSHCVTIISDKYYAANTLTTLVVAVCSAFSSSVIQSQAKSNLAFR